MTLILIGADTALHRSDLVHRRMVSAVEDALNERLGRSDRDLRFTGDDDDAVDVLLELREPVRRELAVFRRAGVAQALRVRELSPLERAVTQIVGNSELQRRCSYVNRALRLPRR